MTQTLVLAVGKTAWMLVCLERHREQPAAVRGPWWTDRSSALSLSTEDKGVLDAKRKFVHVVVMNGCELLLRSTESTHLDKP